jgi:DNA polymerase III epsilon subunit family exonuclease
VSAALDDSGSRGPSLVRSAARFLATGSRHTLEVAREVLGLQGHEGAAAAAVFQLLGTDPRFLVDAEGLWRLDPSMAPYGTPLSDVRFTVVDVETTGRGPWTGNRIIEIAMVETHGGRIVDEYETLINPGQAIPGAITVLTGITSSMVAQAPYFEHVAEEVRTRLEGRAFVAHNATFDWSFVSAELVAAIGDAPDVPRLCTVRMSRRLVPALRQRNLDVLARHFGIENHARHRAHGDALATARVLLRLLDEAAGRGIDDLATLEWYLKRRRRPKRSDAGQYALTLPGYGTEAGRRRRPPGRPT